MTQHESDERLRVLRDADLEFMASNDSPTSHEALLAKAELARRKRRREFWSRIALIPLILLVVAISILIFAGKR